MKILKLTFILVLISGIAGLFTAYSRQAYSWCPMAHGGFSRPQAPPATPTPPPPPPPTPTKPPNTVPTPSPLPTPPPNSGVPTPATPTPEATPSPAPSPESANKDAVASEEPAKEDPNAKFESASRVWENWWQYNQDKFYDFGRIYPFDKIEGVEENDDVRETREKEYKDIWNFLVNNFKDRDVDLRYPAVVALAKSADKFASMEIEKLWDTKDRDVLDAVILSMGLLKDASQSEKLISYLKDKNNHKVTRGFAAFALAYIGHNPAVEIFKNILQEDSEDWEVQCSCAMAIGLMKAAETDFLGGMLNPPEGKRINGNVRAYCALALGRIGGEAAEPHLKKALEDSNEEVRRSAVIAIGQAKYAGCKELLVKTMETDRDPMTRCFAAISLGYLKDESAAEPLLKALGSPESLELQGFAALGLGILGKMQTVAPALRNIVGDTRNFEAVRSAAAVALGLLKDKDSIGILLKGIEKKQYPMLKKYSILAIGMIGEPDKNAIKEIKEAIADAQKRSPDIYRYIMYSLAMLGEYKLVMKELKDDIKADNMDTKMTAIDLTGRLGDTKSAEILINAYKKEKQKIVKQTCLGAMGCLIDRNFKFPLLRNITADNDYFMQLIVIQHVLYIP